MHFFNAFKLGDLKDLFLWLEENIGDFEYESPKREPERFSYYFERRGAGWSYKFISTLNNMDRYPEDFAQAKWESVGAFHHEVKHYAVVEIDGDNDAVLFKLRWTGNASI
jgi:hypothetical protein